VSAPAAADVDWQAVDLPVLVPVLLSVMTDDQLRAFEADAEEHASALTAWWLRGQLVREWRSRATRSR
jgi:hypothetical protein